MTPKIYSPVFRDSGAVIVHNLLSEHIQGYEIETFSPNWQYAPFLLPVISKKFHRITVHTTPDYVPFFHTGDCRLVVTFHNYVLDDEMKKYSTLLQRLHYRTDLLWNIKSALKKADLVTTVSQATADLVKTGLSYDGEIQVIQNGVDTVKFTPGNKEKGRKQIKVLFSGNLTRRKGGHLLKDIAEGLNDNVCIYYTSGLNVRSRLEHHPNLKPLGKITYNDMPGVYQDMDILVLPSIREGLSMAILESMASGLPVVTSNCSSMPEQIVHGIGGYLCEPGNVNDFVEKINHLASSRELRKQMGEFNRERSCEVYSLELMIDRYRNLFNAGM